MSHCAASQDMRGHPQFLCFLILQQVLQFLHCATSQDMQRPLYMRPLDAIEYGVIDRLVPPQKEMKIIDTVRLRQAVTCLTDSRHDAQLSTQAALLPACSASR